MCSHLHKEISITEQRHLIQSWHPFEYTIQTININFLNEHKLRISLKIYIYVLVRVSNGRRKVLSNSLYAALLATQHKSSNIVGMDISAYNNEGIINYYSL